nr:putative periviscerokinin/Cap2b receptor [Ixodes scapularis]
MEDLSAAAAAADSLDDNATIREYLELRLGPQHILLPIVIPLTILYVVVFVSGVVGNVTVCLIIARNSHFQTPTNYYLFSLAISDLLILVFGLPNDLKLYWQQYPWRLGETLCRLRALVAEATSYASVLTIVAFTAERYVAIYHPLFLQTTSSLTRAVRIIAIIWVVSLVSAVPFAIYTRVNFVDFPVGSGRALPESAFCALPMDTTAVSLPLLQCSTFAFFCLPMTVIVVLYLKIGLRLRRQPGPGQARNHRRPVHRMLVAVVIAFFVCWAPFHTQRLLVVYVNPSQWTRGLRTLNEVLYYTAGCLYYFSATINPILYSLMSVKYREAFRDALCTLSKTKQRLSTADFDQAATVVVVGAGPHLLDDSRLAKLGPYSVLPQQDADTVPPVAEAPTMKYLIIQAVLGVKPNVAAVSSCVTKEADDVVSYGEEKNVNEVVRISNENSASSDVKREGETAV